MKELGDYSFHQFSLCELSVCLCNTSVSLILSALNLLHQYLLTIPYVYALVEHACRDATSCEVVVSIGRLLCGVGGRNILNSIGEVGHQHNLAEFIDVSLTYAKVLREECVEFLLQV